MKTLDASTLYKHLQKCMRAWNSTMLPVEAFEGLLSFHQKIGDPQGSLREFILESIDVLENESQQHADLLRLRYFEGATVQEIAHESNLSKDQINRQQRRSLEHLADLIHQKETVLRHNRLQEIETRLPANGYAQLFGVEQHQQNLIDRLLEPDKYHIIALVGMGGIGKTSLANAASRELAPGFHFADIIWARFPQTSLPEPPSPYFMFNWLVAHLAAYFHLEEHSDHHQFLWVRQYLNQARYLIVIDNLHNETQAPEFFIKLNELTGPSKILLTTRTRPAPLADVYSISVDELSLDDAGNLLSYQLDSIGQREEALQIHEHTSTIYHSTGGNPLALKLCAGLLYSLPLSAILHEMEHRQISDVDALYAYIYRELWKELSSNAQSLMEAMPLVDDSKGASIEHISKITKLPKEDILQAIHELSQLSLVEPRGTIEERRYSIHQLTRSFLLKEIINWDEGLK